MPHHEKLSITVTYAGDVFKLEYPPEVTDVLFENLTPGVPPSEAIKTWLLTSSRARLSANIHTEVTPTANHLMSLIEVLN